MSSSSLQGDLVTSLKVIEKEHNTCDWNNRGARVTFRDPAVSLYFHHFARAVYKDEETILVTHRLADNLTAFHSSLAESTLNTKTPQMVYGEHFQIVSFLKVLTFMGYKKQQCWMNVKINKM